MRRGRRGRELEGTYGKNVEGAQINRVRLFVFSDDEAACEDAGTDDGVCGALWGLGVCLRCA